MGVSCAGNGASCQGAAFQDVLTVDGTATRASLLGLKPAQTYQVRLHAANQEGTSEYSSIGQILLPDPGQSSLC